MVPEAVVGGTIVRQWGLSSDLPAAADFDGDGRADIAVYRPGNGLWFVLNPLNGVQQALRQWGLSGDVPIAADYDGDGIVDLAVFRPSNGTWYLQRSTGGVLSIQWGLPSDEPI